jgi:outer membrane receptor protein involved in Fe transport
VKDRLWFFGASRLENSSTASSFPQTNIPFTRTSDSKRYEAKVTGSVRSVHTVQGTFIDNRVHRQEPVLSFSIDPAAFIAPSTPNHLLVTNYSGVISGRVLATAQYSQKHFATEGVGGTSTNIVDSPFLTRTGSQFQYNAPYFDATDPEQRNNRQITGSLSYFLSNPMAGSHAFKGGVEHFTSTRVGGNAQSSTGYVFLSNFRTDAAGAPLLDSQGRLMPMFVPGTSRLQKWTPLRGAEFDITTLSLYVQDRWNVTPRLTFDLGVRYEHASSQATGTGNQIKANTIVPRLSASYDVNADGRMVLQGSYAEYAGKYNDAQFSKNTNVGNSDRYTTVYMGPAGEGRSFSPGFDVSNYSGVVEGTFPAVNVRFDENLSSPLTRELTVGAGRAFRRSFAKVLYVQRKTTNFVEDFYQISNGTSAIVVNGATVGLLDNVVYRNSDVPKRSYQAVEFLGQHTIGARASVSGQWTIQLENNGNFEGESGGNPGASSLIGNYPEMLVLSRNSPEGRLDDFQRHKLRVWANLSVPFGEYGALDIAPLVRYNSGTTFSLVANGVALSPVQLARNPGYAGVPTQTLFFGDRGAQHFEGYGLVDLALTYSIPLWHSVRPWVKVEALNLLNNQKLISWDVTVSPDANSTRDEHGLPTRYVAGARFGQATANSNYPRPRPGLDGGRMYLMAVGIRF